MFSKILIANRGEIACRIIDTCRSLGVRTVAVYSEADAHARHVRHADEAYCVGSAASRDSYLRGDVILDVARRSGAQAIHPGYGFLSENDGFAEACAKAGIVFIGPGVKAIRAMGSKSAAKALMAQAGVPLVPGYHGDDQNGAVLRREADAIGYPVLIKASAGGGGKGMRVVERSADFDAALASCQREASASFGDDRVLIEKYLQRPRHIEVQIFGDSHGQVVHLYERDCSSQRRHQKVVEEAPAPGLSAERRAAMGEAACNAARAVDYVGAGTVEFIVDDTDRFYFMEMNTRLQVEHPVTEMITGVDLVEWQLRVAAGQPLPLAQDDIPLRGHAIEVRVYAEDPDAGFLPSIGPLTVFATPPPSAQVRIDTGFEHHDAVSPHYDPMLAKLIVHDSTRAACIARLLMAIDDFHVAGVTTNLPFLARLVDHPAFRDGAVDTGLIERAGAALLSPSDAPPLRAVQAAALWQLDQERAAARHHSAAAHHSPWRDADGWRMNADLERHMAFRSGTHELDVTVVHTPAGVLLDGAPATMTRRDDDTLRCHVGTHCFSARVVTSGSGLQVFCEGAHHLEPVDPLAHTGDAHAVDGTLTAPMPGKIIALPIAVGSQVAKGTPLVVMEAMKMEHTLVAPAAGTVSAYRCALGEQVQDGVSLVDFTPDA